VRGEAVPETMLWSAVAAGGAHSCGASVEGTTFCWGENGSGQLGNGSTEGALAPSPIGPGN
jgi:alpha-tubulin suppressor-like RCC1 family protein